MNNMQQMSYAPGMHLERQPVKIALAGRNVALTLTGHPLKGCTGGLTNPVFRLAAMLG